MCNDEGLYLKPKMTQLALAMTSFSFLCACAGPQPESGASPSAVSPAQKVQWVAYGVVESIQRIGPDAPHGVGSLRADPVRIGIRLDDGRLYSVEQDSAAGLVPGQRVKVEEGRVSAAGPAS